MKTIIVDSPYTRDPEVVREKNVAERIADVMAKIEPKHASCIVQGLLYNHFEDKVVGMVERHLNNVGLSGGLRGMGAPRGGFGKGPKRRRW